MNKMTCLFAVALAASFCGAKPMPLPEHPRPDWERPAWMNLNGEWDFGFAEGKLDRKITVPFGWGSKLSGVKDEGDTGWYRRKVRVPASWKGKRVFLVVGASDHDTTCWFDKSNLGTHSGGYTPFEFELTDHVTWGQDQTIRFKVWDAPASLAHHDWRLYGKQGYGNARGIWQTVYLEARGGDYFKSIKFYPDLENRSVTAKVRLALPAAKPLTATLALGDKVATATVPFAPGEMEKSVDIKLKEPHLWSLDDPFLYDVSATLAPTANREPRTSNLEPRTSTDTVKTYFGFRSIGAGKNPATGEPCVTLNGKPIYLRLTLDQSYHPDGWYTFPSDAFMKNEILISKNLGLSGNRVHIKAEIPRKLYWADKLGVLIMADVPCAWGAASEAMFREHRFCFEGMVERDFNHPCVFSWVLFNETWGLFADGENWGSNRASRYAPWVRRAVADIWAEAKALDPTRLVEDNSACNWDHVVTDLNTWHAYVPGYCWEAEVKGWCDRTGVGRTENYIGGLTQPGVPMMNSECGNVWGYSGSSGDVDQSWDYHWMQNAFRRNLKCGGWLYTEHHDVINEWNGYVRFDRSPKYAGWEELCPGMTTKDLHGDAYLVLDPCFYKVAASGATWKMPVSLSLVSDKWNGKALTLWTGMRHWDATGKLVVDPMRKAAFVQGKPWKVEKVADVDVKLPTGASCGAVTFELRDGGTVIARNFAPFATDLPKDGRLVPTKAEWSLGSTNVLAGLKLNGFGKGYFEFEIAAPAAGGTFRAELSSRPVNGKDSAAKDKGTRDLDCMLGGGFADHSKNPNSYPMTSDERHNSIANVYADGKLVKTVVLANDPCDHRGILSWIAQPHDHKLREAGTYGELVEAAIPASAVKNGKVKIRIEADCGLAVYGPCFGRYAFGPNIK